MLWRVGQAMHLCKVCSRCFRAVYSRCVSSRAAQDAADREALNKELAACKNVAALVEKQKHDAVREGALLRDEIVALRGKVSNLGAERVRALRTV